MTKAISFKKYSIFLSDTLFVLSGALLGFRSCVGMSPIGLNFIFKIITGVIWGMMFISFILNSYTFKEIIISLFLLFLGLCVFKYSESTAFVFNYFAIVASKNRPLSKSIKYFIWGIFVAFFFNLLLVFGDFFPNEYMAEQGWCFGYKNPNTAAFFAFYIVIYMEYAYYEKLQFSHIFLLTLFGVLFSYLTGSRTASIITIFSGLSHLFFKTNNKLKKYFFNLIFPFAIFIGIFVLLGISFCNIIPLFTKVDEILSGRFSQAQYYILKYGIHLFGVKILELDSEYRALFLATEGWVLPYLDSGYARFFINYGIISYLIIISLYWKRLYIAKKDKDIRLSLLILNILLIMVIDNSTNMIIYNFSMIFLVDALFNRKILKKIQ